MQASYSMKTCSQSHCGEQRRKCHWKCRVVVCGRMQDIITNAMPCRSALILYRQILDGIEKNGYNNFTKRSYVPKWKKLLSLPHAAVKARSAVNLKAYNQL